MQKFFPTRRQFISFLAAVPFVNKAVASEAPVAAVAVEPAKTLTPMPHIGDLWWGTYGKNQCHSLKYVPLNDCANDHLEAIIRDVDDGKQSTFHHVYQAIKAILEWRKENNIVIETTSLANAKDPLFRVTRPLFPVTRTKPD